MSDRKVIWKGKRGEHKSILFIEDGATCEEVTFFEGNTGIFSLSSFLDDWKRGRYTGPPLPEEVKVEMAIRELKR